MFQVFLQFDLYHIFVVIFFCLVYPKKGKEEERKGHCPFLITNLQNNVEENIDRVSESTKINNNNNNNNNDNNNDNDNNDNNDNNDKNDKNDNNNNNNNNNNNK